MSNIALSCFSLYNNKNKHIQMLCGTDTAEQKQVFYSMYVSIFLSNLIPDYKACVCSLCYLFQHHWSVRKSETKYQRD